MDEIHTSLEVTTLRHGPQPRTQVSCCKTFVILVTDGEPTQDTNIPVACATMPMVFMGSTVREPIRVALQRRSMEHAMRIQPLRPSIYWESTKLITQTVETIIWMTWPIGPIPTIFGHAAERPMVPLLS